MREKYILLCGNDLRLSYHFLYSDTYRYFSSYLIENSETTADINVHVTHKFIKENRWLVEEDEQSLPFAEYQCLMLATGNVLLKYRYALFHGAAFLWKGYAWIITAPSGTGKTTQLCYWRKLFRKDIKVINGDKPLLECREDGGVWVHSSPWRGKERMGEQDLHAPLGGILLLEQNNYNSIRILTPEEAVVPLFIEFVSYPECEEQILGQAQILRQILDTIPVWKLDNVGDEDSALLTYKTLCNWLEEER